MPKAFVENWQKKAAVFQQSISGFNQEGRDRRQISQGASARPSEHKAQPHQPASPEKTLFLKPGKSGGLAYGAPLADVGGHCASCKLGTRRCLNHRVMGLQGVEMFVAGLNTGPYDHTGIT